LLSTVLGIVVMLVWSVRVSLLSSQPWKNAFQQSKIYENILPDIITEAYNNPDTKKSITSDFPITSAELTDLLNATVPSNFLQTQVEKTLDLIFSLVTGKASLDTAKLEIPLQDIKNRLPVAAKELLIKKIKALPICTSQQINQFAKNNQLTSLPSCRPKELDARAVVDESFSLAEVTDKIPDSVDLVAEIKKSSNNSSGQESPVQTVEKVQGMVELVFGLHLLVAIIWVILLLGLFAIFLPILRRSFHWFSIGLFIPTFILLIVSLVAKGQVVRIALPGSDSNSAILTKYFEPIFQNLGGQLITQLQIFALVGVIVSIVAFVIQFAWAPKKPNK